MSKERDLLQTALGILEDYEWGYGGDHHKSPEASILNDIRKLLAEPEEEPKFNFDLERMKVAIESPISDVTVDDLAKQVKQEPVAWIIETEIYGKLSEWVCTDKKHYMDAHDAIKAPIPLYTAPKRYPLTNEEICEILLKKEWKGFVELVRIIESIHGIEGGE